MLPPADLSKLAVTKVISVISAAPSFTA